MLKTSKEQRWEETGNRLMQVTDLLGMPIDDAIRDVVIALNVLDINTLASCEGHLDHGCAYPWIDIGDPDARPLAKIAHMKQMAVEQAPRDQREALIAEAQEARLAVKRLHVVERTKLMTYLNRFYAERQVSCDQRLIMNTSEWSGIARLESQGADCQDCRTVEERAQCLQQYREEMGLFGLFLRSLYWSE